MIYVGFVIEVGEAIRLLGLDESIVSCFYDTEPIQKYLKDEGSDLKFFYIDKGACLFGLRVHTSDRVLQLPYSTVDNTIVAILKRKDEFLKEIRKLKIDISQVNITWSEEESRLVENPQPYVISV